MVTYNPKDWFKLIFQFHKSDTFRILFPTMFLLGAITAGVCYIEKKYIEFNIPTITIFHQISGFVISMVLVFRINTAYDRWWEGRKLWGSLINVSRNLAIKISTFVPESDLKTRKELATLITNFPFSLKEHLRGNPTLEDITFLNNLSEEEYKSVTHKPALIIKRLTAQVMGLCRQKNENSNDVLWFSNNLNEFMDICGACERI